jgi:hypothetical protein
MLTRELAIAAYENGRIVPDRLTRKSHARYAGFADRMLRVYRTGVGRTRQELHRDVHALFAHEPDCPVRRIDAFCKLLDDVSTFEQDRRGRAAALRRRVFRMAAPYHPLVRCADRLFEHTEAEVKAQVAGELKMPWAQIDRELFADVMEFHRLVTFQGYSDGTALLARYNVAQVQVALFSAVAMTVWATEDFKTILRYAKLARLMHTIRRTGPGHYVIRFDGPASVLRETRRYGVGMARFLPALLACRGWRLQAIIQTPRRGWTVGLDLSPDSGLNSHLPAPAEFDSDIEHEFAHKWGAEMREGWSLVREGAVLHQGQHVFVPDFVLRHQDGRVVLLEIVGFWTPEYLQAKLQTLRTFHEHPILLAVSEAIGKDVPGVLQEAIRFKSALSIKQVLDRVRTLA